MTRPINSYEHWMYGDERDTIPEPEKTAPPDFQEGDLVWILDDDLVSHINRGVVTSFYPKDRACYVKTIDIEHDYYGCWQLEKMSPEDAQKYVSIKEIL